MPRVPSNAMRTGSALLRGASRRKRRGKLFRGRLTHRIESEPAGHILVADAAAAHNFAALFHHAAPVTQEKRESPERSVLPDETAADDDHIAGSNGKKVAPVKIGRNIL